MIQRSWSCGSSVLGNWQLTGETSKASLSPDVTKSVPAPQVETLKTKKNCYFRTSKRNWGPGTYITANWYCFTVDKYMFIYTVYVPVSNLRESTLRKSSCTLRQSAHLEVNCALKPTSCLVAGWYQCFFLDSESKCCYKIFVSLKSAIINFWLVGQIQPAKPSIPARYWIPKLCISCLPTTDFGWEPLINTVPEVLWVSRNSVNKSVID